MSVEIDVADLVAAIWQNQLSKDHQNYLTRLVYLQDAPAPASSVGAPKKVRTGGGRPKGSKNKPKVNGPATEPVTAAAA